MTDYFRTPPDPSMPDPEDMGCGTRTIWETPRGDPFYNACAAHDAAYNAQSSGLTNEPSSAKADKALLTMMLEATDGGWWYTVRAYTFYGLARVYGMFSWPTGG